MNDPIPDPRPIAMLAFFRDHAERVTVPLLPPGKWVDLASLQDDEPRMIEFVLGWSAGKADGLTVEGHRQLIAAIDSLHREEVRAWKARVSQRGGDSADLLRFLRELGDPHRS